MGCAACVAELAGFRPEEAFSGDAAAAALVRPASDLRPSVYPRAKKTAQTITRPKNKPSNFAVPSVISVSCVESINVAYLKGKSHIHCNCVAGNGTPALHLRSKPATHADYEGL